MKALGYLSLLALCVAPAAAFASVGAVATSSTEIAAVDDGAATGEAPRQQADTRTACLTGEVAVYSSHTGEFWCAVVK